MFHSLEKQIIITTSAANHRADSGKRRFPDDLSRFLENKEAVQRIIFYE
jgi:hypothetical protein